MASARPNDSNENGPLLGGLKKMTVAPATALSLFLHPTWIQHCTRNSTTGWKPGTGRFPAWTVIPS